jgi:hypothetical protein
MFLRFDVLQRFHANSTSYQRQYHPDILQIVLQFDATPVPIYRIKTYQKSRYLNAPYRWAGTRACYTSTLRRCQQQPRSTQLHSNTHGVW